MNSQYVQTASLNTKGSKNNVSFYNMSSQQQSPGYLVQWFEAQNSAMQPMPFTNSQIPIPENTRFGDWLSEEATNVSSMNKTETLSTFFTENTRSGRAMDVRQQSQRLWGVPEHLAEARANDMF